MKDQKINLIEDLLIKFVSEKNLNLIFNKVYDMKNLKFQHQDFYHLNLHLKYG